MIVSLLKITLVVLATLAVVGFAPRMSSAARHSVIVAGLVGALLVPILENLLPKIELAVLPAPAEVVAVQGTARAFPPANPASVVAAG